MVIIVLLCVAEALVLTVLAPAGGVPRTGSAYLPAGGLPAWFEYPAFLLSLEAMCMGLALVAWALIPTADATPPAASVPGTRSAQAAERPAAAETSGTAERPAGVAEHPSETASAEAVFAPIPPSTSPTLTGMPRDSMAPTRLVVSPVPAANPTAPEIISDGKPWKGYPQAVALLVSAGGVAAAAVWWKCRSSRRRPHARS